MSTKDEQAGAPTLTKKCIKCGEVKEYTEFHKSKERKGGIHSICRKCKNHYSKLYRRKTRGFITEEEKERIRVYNRERYKNLTIEKKAAIRQQKRLHVNNNLEKYTKRNAQYYKKNREVISHKASFYNKQRTKDLVDPYVIGIMCKALNLTREECTPELIESYRGIMLLNRKLKEARKLCY